MKGFQLSFLLCAILFEVVIASPKDTIADEVANLNFTETNQNLSPERNKETKKDVVKIQMYYESLCPTSRRFYANVLTEIVQKFGDRLEITTYPYAEAETFERDGHYEFKCQHGPLECYGNKLHACAIDELKNMTATVLLTGCMMDRRLQRKGSNDLSADNCAKTLNIDSEPIKECAKNDRGSNLLKYYGDETKKITLETIPYILLNGVVNDRHNFIHDVCVEFENPPAACTEYL